MGVNGKVIGVEGWIGEGGSGIMVCKVISEVKNMEMIVCYVVKFIYEVEVGVGGFECKGIWISWG